MTKKIFAMFLAVLMVASVLPTSVFAANECPAEHTKDNCNCVVVKVTEPTCGDNGYTTYQCKDCGEIFADNFKPATGVHSMVAGEGKAPTCGSAGYEAGMECEFCGKPEEGKEIPAVVAPGYQCAYKDMTPEIDCTTGGKKEQKCVVCGHEKTVTVPKGEHAWDYDNYVVKAEPTKDEAGIVVVSCEVCSATKEATWFGGHSCEESAQWNRGYAATCTTDGVIPHFECRICGKMWNVKQVGGEDVVIKYVAGEVADDESTAFVEGRGVILKASHTEPAPKAGETIDLCKDRVAKCAVCGEKVTFKGAHKLAYETDDLYHKNDCTNDGFQLLRCQNGDCTYTELKTIPAKGHVLHTVTVPATCGTYGYTFTVCMRENCNKALGNTSNIIEEDGVDYDVSLDFVPAKELVAGEVAYKFGYALNKYYTAFEFELVANTDFQGFPIAGEYKILAENGKYVIVTEDLVGDEGYGYYAPSVGFTADATKASVFTWSETYNVFTTSMKLGEYFLMYNYMYGTLLDVADVHMFGYAYYLPYQVFYNTGISQLIDFEVAEKAGYDENNHVLTKDVVKKATCTSEGLRYDMCTNHDCDYFEQVVLAVTKHNTVTLKVDTSDDAAEKNAELAEKLAKAGYEVAVATLEADLVALLNLEDINVTAKTLYRAADCEKAGWAYVLCLDCGAIEKDVTDAYGHTYVDWIAPYDVPASHLNPSYSYWPCYYCDSIKTTNVKPWKDASKTWDTLLDAQIAHGGHYDFEINENKEIVYKVTVDGVECFLTKVNKDKYWAAYDNIDFEGTYLKFWNAKDYDPTGKDDKTPIADWVSDLTFVSNYRDGDCEKQGLVKYFCEACETTVYVKQWKELEIEVEGVTYEIEYMTGSHVVTPGKLASDIKVLNQYGKPVAGEAPVVTAGTWIIDTNNPWLVALYPNAKHFEGEANCETYGYIVTYKCACCDKTIGSNNIKDGYVGTALDKGDHKFVINETTDYNPCPNGAPYVCKYCGETRDTLAGDMTLNPCTDTILEYYLCSCGEEHIRGIYGPFGHVFEITSNLGTYVVETDNDKCDTAAEKASYIDGHDKPYSLTYDCVYCDVDDKTVEQPKLHMNKDEEIFTELCTDTVKDRHCVLCCDHDSKGNTHDCYKKQNGKYVCAGQCIILAVCHPIAGADEANKNSSCTMPAYSVDVCRDCDKQTVTLMQNYTFDAKYLVANGNAPYTLDPAYLASLSVWQEQSDKMLSNMPTIEEEIIVGVKDTSSAVNFMGHKPAEVDYEMKWNDVTDKYEPVYKNGKKVPVYYSNCVYKDIEWTSYKWVKVMVPTVKSTVDHNTGVVTYTYELKEQTVLVQFVEKYTAKYEKYQAPSYTADGVMATKCQICEADVEQVLPKKTGIGFEMSIANANGQSGLAFGSLIEVTVSVNALDAAIYGFEFDITNTMGKDMIYVGYEIANENFSVTVTDPIKVAHKGAALKISGFAVNNADGKVQNIEITEKTALVKLYFRSVSEATGKYEFKFANTAATALIDGATKAIVANFTNAKATIAGLMDFNGDKVASSADLYQAMTLITGEHASGKTYNVTVDLNKDGELTLEDLAIGYNYLVGNYDRIEMLMLGLSADDAEELAELMKEMPAYPCMNEVCDYGSKYYFDVCPICRTVQPKQPVKEEPKEEPEVIVYACVNKEDDCDYTSETAFNFCPKCRKPQSYICEKAGCGYSEPTWFVFCVKCGTTQTNCDAVDCENQRTEGSNYCAEAVCPVTDCKKHGCEKAICPDCKMHDCTVVVCPDCKMHEANCTCVHTCACEVAEAHNGGRCDVEVDAKGEKCTACAYNHEE